MRIMKTLVAALALLAPLALQGQARQVEAAPPPRPAPRVVPAQLASPGRLDTTQLAGIRWREIGPARGGRSVAVAGSVKRPNEYWFGTTGGGVFKTTDGGLNWAPASDRYFGGTIGAIAVDPQDSDIVWVGGGETQIRGNTSYGDGLWKTTNGGRTWEMLGFKDEFISTIRVHPTNSNVAYIGVFGDVFKSGPRGLYKTTDGGKTFSKILNVNDSTGVGDIGMESQNPDVLYVSFWQAWRSPWGMSSGGIHSAIYKTTDGGATWTNLMRTAKGIPTGVVGKIGLAVSPVRSGLLWAQIEHDSGGVYRSGDGGATWEWINKERKLRQRAWYYSQLNADPKDTMTVYAMNVGFFRSRDGGKTFPQTLNPPHGDNHDLWIAPDNPQRMIQGNDGGANVSLNAGATWTDQDFATAQFYHISTTNEYPYKICGAQQDNSTLCGPSRKQGGNIQISDWYDAGGCESGYIAAHPLKPNITFAGCYGGNLDRRDRETGFTRDVTVYPRNPMGHSSEDIKVRFNWTFPIVFSRHNPNVLYAAGSQLFRSTNEGESWTAVSPELARRDPRTMGPSGGPITKDQTGVETYGIIFAFDESPVTPGLLWAGTDDGLIYISRDNGVRWTNVTPQDIGDFTRVSIIEPSRYAPGTAYVAANRYALGDRRPIFYRTTDYGRTWTAINNGIASDHFGRVIREDPVRRGLLFAGTERGVYMSFDDGANWQSLQRSLPPVPVHDLQVKDNDVIVATHGRSFWVMDDISSLRQVTPAILAKDAHLYKPVDTYRTQWGGGGFGGGGGGGGGANAVGANPRSGAIVYYTLKSGGQKVTLDFMDAKGEVIQAYTSEQSPEQAADSVNRERARTAAIDSLVGGGLTRDSATKVVAARPAQGQGGGGGGGGGGGAPPRPRVPNRAGLNTFSWNLRYPDAVGFEGLIMWAANTTGPVAPPGTYSVRLKVNDGEAQTQSFRVRKDPRSTSTDADLMEQFRLLIAIRDKTTEANNAVRMVRNMRWNVGDRTGKLNDQQRAEFKSIADGMMGELTKAEQEAYQTKNESNQDPLNFPIRLNNEIAGVASYVGQGEYRPTQQARQVFDMLSKELDVQLKAIKSSMDRDLPKLNAILRAAGLQELRPSTEEIKPQRGNVAM